MTFHKRFFKFRTEYENKLKKKSNKREAKFNKRDRCKKNVDLR